MDGTRDVEYLLHKGTWRFKALTPAAKTVFLTLLQIPPDAGTITEAFMHATLDRGPELLAKLQSMGLQTEAPVVAPPPVKAPEPPPTHLWAW